MKRLLVFILALVSIAVLFTNMSSKNIEPEKPELIYVYDPLCGWCYGFSPVMIRLKENFMDQLNYKVISGGMVIGEREGAIGEKAPYIKWAYKHVEDGTGVKFGEPFLKGVLEEGTMFFSSWPPSIAMTVVKSMDEKKSLEFAHLIQKQIYYEGKDPNQAGTYSALLKNLQIDSLGFTKRFQDTTYKTLTKEDFKTSKDLGVTGFPTVFLKKNGKLHQLARGYETYDKMEKKIRNLME